MKNVALNLLAAADEYKMRELNSMCENPGEIYFENSSKYYLKSSLNKLRIALHSMLRKDFVVFSKSQNHLGRPCNRR
jgi:hypothetical protein